MRQVGVLAAAGLVALERGPLRLQEDHDNAAHLARALGSLPRIRLDPGKVRTNIVIADIRQTGLTSADFLKALADRHVLAVPVDAGRIRFVTHLDVDRVGIDAAIAAIREVSAGAAAAPRTT